MQEKKFNELAGLAVREKGVLRLLISMTYDKQGLISWRAIEAVGIITGSLSMTNPEIVRNLIGRLLWMIRDESGGIGRIGKINAGFAEYANTIAGRYLCDSEPVIRGYAAWALGETGTSESVNDLNKLQNDNSIIAIYAEGELKEITVGGIAKEAIEKITIRN